MDKDEIKDLSEQVDDDGNPTPAAIKKLAGWIHEKDDCRCEGVRHCLFDATDETAAFMAFWEEFTEDYGWESMSVRSSNEKNTDRCLFAIGRMETALTPFYGRRVAFPVWCAVFWLRVDKEERENA